MAKLLNLSESKNSVVENNATVVSDTIELEYSTYELLKKEGVYSDQHASIPTAERLEHVIVFEITTGCSYGKCTFCNFYKNQKYGLKSLIEYKKHVEHVWNTLERVAPERIDKITRVFIGSGNALSFQNEKELINALRFTTDEFNRRTGRVAKRTSIYATTNDILKKENLGRIRCGGTCDGNNCPLRIYGRKIGVDLIYWGVESGSSKVLDYCNKGYDKESILRAGREIGWAGLEVSMMIIVGLGGKKFEKEHTKETIMIINEIKPKFVNFIGINPAVNSPYFKKMEKEIEAGTNRPLTPKEKVNQMIEMIKKIEFETTVGCINNGTGDNPITFNSRKLSSYGGFDFARKLRIKAEKYFDKKDKDFTTKLTKGKSLLILFISGFIAFVLTFYGLKNVNEQINWFIVSASVLSGLGIILGFIGISELKSEKKSLMKECSILLGIILFAFVFIFILDPASIQKAVNIVSAFFGAFTFIFSVISLFLYCLDSQKD
jgi:hypothetical protein